MYYLINRKGKVLKKSPRKGDLEYEEMKLIIKEEVKEKVHILVSQYKIIWKP